MTTTPPDTSQPSGPAPDTGPQVTWEDIRDLARIRRSRTDRRVAGVAGGLARHLDIDPVILRVAFVVLTFFGGVGLLLYVALWLLLPEDGKDWATIKLDRRSRTVALFVIGVFALVLLVSHGWWGTPGPLFFLAAIVGVIVVAMQLTRRDRPPGSRAVGQPWSASDPPTPGQASPTVDDAQRPHAAGTPPWSGGNLAYSPPPPRAYPPSYAVPEQPRPVNPRKKGPILFWYAVATMLVALGGLLIANLAGAHVAPSAYPATVLGLSAVFLLVGSFFGRAGGVILVGLLAAATTVGATVADRWDPHSSTYVPAVASAVQSRYSMDVGELRLDLTSVMDPKQLDGRDITVHGNVGHLDIMVPDNITVVTNAHVTGTGGIDAFGRNAGGVDTELHTIHSGGPGAPRLTIDADLHVGQIDITDEPVLRRSLP